jgi:hypothetical protein
MKEKSRGGNFRKIRQRSFFGCVSARACVCECVLWLCRKFVFFSDFSDICVCVCPTEFVSSLLLSCTSSCLNFFGFKISVGKKKKFVQFVQFVYVYVSRWAVFSPSLPYKTNGWLLPLFSRRIARIVQQLDDDDTPFYIYIWYKT